ncbi:hypothetical protein DQ384_21865 [Sphaerisporangium album]|uniref:Uncharacterized protein n=1 Tax=Sphaerisporangium album TaxID=509200 RepID=A0A367FGP9_9ACTN|nr:hypothetical protein [Sphaerisporangium album]RCG29002.1 hypothetical protein DQ384_21865 [Sphaerisporangium album]
MGTLDPTDTATLLRRIAALEKRLRAMQVIMTGGQYAHDESGGNRTVASTGAFLDYTGQPTVSIVVPASGKVRVSGGFSGYNNATGTSTLRVAPVLSGANTAAPTTANSASAAGDNNGAATDPVAVPRSTSRTKVYTDLTPGTTTFKLQGRISSGTTSTHAIQDSWLLVEPLP